MGISNFFSYISKQNDTNCTDEQKYINYDVNIDLTVTRLYIDFNGIIFDVLAENPEIDTDNLSDEIKIKNKITEKIKFFRFLFPNAHIHIFLEAIPTVAKMKEQYGRRLFDNIYDDIDDNLKKRFGIKETDEFDKTKLGFNLEFSAFMSETINQIKTEISDNILIHSFDNSDLDKKIGEAEHRMLYHITNTVSDINNQKFIIISADADLILLSVILTTKLSNKNIEINLVRRSNNENERKTFEGFGENIRKFYLINIHNFINFFYLKNNNNNKSKYDYILDLMFVFNILGDDFIPPIIGFVPHNDMDKIFNALNNVNGLILENDNIDKKKINVQNLYNFFNYNELIDIKQKPYTQPKRVDDDVDINMNYTQIVYNFIKDKLFSKGIYFVRLDDSTCKYNRFLFDSILKKNPNYKITDRNIPNNLIVKNIGYFDRNINDNLKKIGTDLAIFYQGKNNDGTFSPIINKIGLNCPVVNKDRNFLPKYDYVSLTYTDNKNNSNLMVSDNILQNYIEGYTFVLDLYFNLNGKTNNNFWYYKYNISPSFQNIRDYLYKIINGDIEFTRYDKISYDNISYFSYNEYREFIKEQIVKNINDIKLKIGKSINQPFIYEDLYCSNKGNIIFDCKDKIYLNKCIIKSDNNNIAFKDPIEWINNKRNTNIIGGLHYEKYLKYKKKYLELKYKLKI